MNKTLRGFKLIAFALLLPVAITLVVFAQTAIKLPQDVRYVTGVEGINEYRLANGLRVLLFPDSTKSTITVNITYMVGSRHEQYGETGMAHLLEHLVFMGSTNHPDIKKELQDHGTFPNGSTSYDRTNYFETFQATDENLNWALSMEADRMVNSFIAQKDLDSEMTVVRNELEAGENQPFAILIQRALSTAYLWHNYGKSVVGARSDIEMVSIENLKAFYKHFYQPDNALLVVAGKIDEQKTLDLVHKHFSPIPKPTRKLRTTYTIEPTQDGERSVTLRRVGDFQALTTVHHVPAGTHEDFAPMELVADILGDRPSGRFHKALVESGKAVEVGAFAHSLKEPGVKVGYVVLRQEQSMPEAEAILLSTLDSLTENPFTEEEVSRAKTKFMSRFDLVMNNSEMVAIWLSEWQAKGDWRLLFLHRDRIRDTKVEDVQRVAGKYLISSNRTIGRFIPDKEPIRAEITAAPDAESLVAAYKSDVLIAQGEEFDATNENIEKRIIRTTLQGGQKLELLNKKTRGEQVLARITLPMGNEITLKGRSASAASLAGSMLMRGSKNHTRQQINDEFDRLKANVNISSGYSSASVSVQTTRENLKAVIDLITEILREPTFLQSEFDELLKLKLAELEMRKSDPMTMATTALQRHMSPFPKDNIRYMPTIEESIEALKNTNLEQVKEFYKSFFGASHARIVVVGDFDTEALKTQLDEKLATWKSPSPWALLPDSYQKISPTTQAILSPDKPNAMWVAGSAFQMSDTDPDYAAISLADHIFGSGGMNSRLFASIRTREGLSYGVGGQFAVPSVRDNAIFVAYAICAPENAPKVEAVFKEELKKLLEDGFTAEEVEAAKKSMIQQFQVSRSQDATLVGILSNRNQWDRTLEFDINLEKQIVALTPEQVLKAVRKHIDPSQISYFRVGDFEKAKVTW